MGSICGVMGSTCAVISVGCAAAQTDIHSPNITVFESLQFSAALRFARGVEKDIVAAFIEEVGPPPPPPPRAAPAGPAPLPAAHVLCGRAPLTGFGCGHGGA